MIIAGCDYSTHGEYWAVLEDCTIRRIYKRIYPSKLHLEQRLANIDGWPIETIHGDDEHDAHTASWVVVEGYVHFHDRGGKLAGVHWAIRARASRHSRSIIELSPGRWKAGIGLPGNAGKQEIKQHILNLYPTLPATLMQDAYDAVGIARAAFILFPDANERS